METAATITSKVEIISAIDKALKDYSDFMKKMDACGLDLSGVEALSKLAYTLEDCNKFIESAC